MYLQDTKLFRLSLAVAKGCDSMDKIELRLLNEDNELYKIFFQGEVIGKQLNETGRECFKINVCYNPEKIETLLAEIGCIFLATFYNENGCPIISGTPNYSKNCFIIWEKNSDQCPEYSNKKPIVKYI